MSGTAINDLAADLEAAADRALKAGATPGEVIIIVAQFIGYAVANGCPGHERTIAGLRLAQEAMAITAAEVFNKSSPLHATMGNA